MSIQEILTGGFSVALLLTLIQVTPIKVNPWSAIGNQLKKIPRAIGRAMNADVMEKLSDMEKAQAKTDKKLDEHIKIDDARNADWHRARILEFNAELRRGAQRSEEDFNEVLYNIDCYERYCADHPEYPNSRAIHAISHIKGLYDVHMDQNDFCE